MALPLRWCHDDYAAWLIFCRCRHWYFVDDDADIITPWWFMMMIDIDYLRWYATCWCWWCCHYADDDDADALFRFSFFFLRWFYYLMMPLSTLRFDDIFADADTLILMILLSFAAWWWCYQWFNTIDILMFRFRRYCCCQYWYIIDAIFDDGLPLIDAD